MRSYQCSEVFARLSEHEVITRIKAVTLKNGEVPDVENRYHSFRSFQDPVGDVREVPLVQDHL